MPQSSSRPLVVIGSLNVDLVFHVAHMPAAGETATAGEFTQQPGGKGANQAAAAARLGADVWMLGCLGDDDAAELLLQSLRDAGVRTQAIARSAKPTGTAAILLAASGENSIVVAPGANALLSLKHLQQHASLVQNAGIILTQLETPLPTLAALLASAPQVR